MSFHINPKTGEPGRCRATLACPFGLPEDHFSSEAAAREAYEAKNSPFHENVQEVKFSLPLDGETVALLRSLTGSGMRPLIVGGAVRDSLIAGVASKDVDIEVHGATSMDDLSQALSSAGYFVDEVGKSFGVLKTVLPNGMDIDISLPRRDSLVGEGHRGFEVEVDSSMGISEAAARRDFTINALYYDYEKGVILDAHGGLSDWKKKELRHVSSAFAEDPLRVLRGVQFVSRFGLKLAPETAELSRSIKDQYENLSRERVQEEWQKFFTKGKDVRSGLDALRATGWDEHFHLQEVEVESASADVETVMSTAQSRGLPREVLGPAALAFHVDSEHRESFLRSTIVGEKPVNKMLRLMAVEETYEYDDVTLNAWARNQVKAASSTIEEWDALHGSKLPPRVRQNLESRARAAGCWAGPKPDLLTGQMILDAAGTKKGGPWVGAIQREAAGLQDRGLIMTDEDAKAWVSQKVKGMEL